MGNLNINTVKKFAYGLAKTIPLTAYDIAELFGKPYRKGQTG